MKLFLLSPQSIGYFSLLILCSVIVAYLLFVRKKVTPQQDRINSSLLIGTITALGTLVLLLFLQVSFVQTWNIVALYLQSTTASVVLLLLIQFAYRYPSTIPPQKREANVFLMLSAGYTVFELWLAANRFLLFFEGGISYRPVYADYSLIFEVIWLLFIFFRRSVKASRQYNSARWYTHYLNPQGRSAQSTRSFLWLILIGLALVLFDHTTMYLELPDGLFSGVLFFGLLLLLNSFTMVYINYFPELVGLRERLIIVGLTTNLAILSITAWVMQYPGLYPDLYPEMDLAGKQVRYTLNAAGGYDLTTADSVVSSEVGDQIDAFPYELTLPFDFPFYGQNQTRLMIYPDGYISFGEESSEDDLRNWYGEVPAIFAHHYPVSENYKKGNGEGITVLAEPDQVVITWRDIPEELASEQHHSFRLALYPDGMFEIAYLEGELNPGRIFNLPAKLQWLTGVTPGNQSGPFEILQAIPGTSSSGEQNQALILDFRYRIHDRLDGFMRVFIPLMVLSTLGIIVLFPVILSKSVLIPVKELISSVNKVRQGDFTVSLESEYEGELGVIYNTFNTLTAELSSLGADQPDQDGTFSRIFDHSPSSVLIVNKGFHIVYINQMFVEMTGYQRDEAIGQTPNLLTSGKTLMDVYRKLWFTILEGDVWRGEILNKRKNGEEYWAYVVVAPIKDSDGKNSHYVWIMEDFTERKEAEEALVELSITDPLTGIYNRRQLFVLGENSAQQASRYKTELSVLMIDVDYFKQINDIHGHQVGDEVLILLADSIKGNIRAADILGRYGGEEFLIIMPNTNLDGAMVAAEHLREIIEQLAHQVEGDMVNPTVSIGVCDLKPGMEVFEQVVNGADQALYLAKGTGRNQVRGFAGEEEMPWQFDVTPAA